MIRLERHRGWCAPEQASCRSRRLESGKEMRSCGYADPHSAVGVRPRIAANALSSAVGCVCRARDRFLDRSRLSRPPQKALTLLPVGISRLPTPASEAARFCAGRICAFVLIRLCGSLPVRGAAFVALPIFTKPPLRVCALTDVWAYAHAHPCFGAKARNRIGGYPHPCKGASAARWWRAVSPRQ